MNTRPLVSVVIPAYNRQTYLAAAIESVLLDSYRPVQIIVVDDGSTDRTADVVRQFASSIDYVYQAHAGAAVARNRGVTKAQGDYFAFLDSDDLWVNEKLHRQMRTFEAQPELDAVFGYVEQFYSSELSMKNDRLRKLLPGYSLGAMIVRSTAFWNTGAFRTDLQLADSVEWLSRFFQTSPKTILLEDVVLRRRIHGGNIGVSRQKERIEYVRAMKSLLDQKRMKMADQ